MSLSKKRMSGPSRPPGPAVAKTEGTKTRCRSRDDPSVAPGAAQDAALSAAPLRALLGRSHLAVPCCAVLCSLLPVVTALSLGGNPHRPPDARQPCPLQSRPGQRLLRPAPARLPLHNPRLSRRPRRLPRATTAARRTLPRPPPHRSAAHETSPSATRPNSQVGSARAQSLVVFCAGAPRRVCTEARPRRRGRDGRRQPSRRRYGTGTGAQCTMRRACSHHATTTPPTNDTGASPTRRLPKRTPQRRFSSPARVDVSAPSFPSVGGGSEDVPAQPAARHSSGSTALPGCSMRPGVSVPCPLQCLSC